VGVLFCPQKSEITASAVPAWALSEQCETLSRSGSLTLQGVQKHHRRKGSPGQLVANNLLSVP
ncbi:hypothetical protein, partial [Pseudomonas sp. GM48]|uniref:hypothetical protein n=1 Tax=Pseudomonas sp. GM48 TaxID=1144330 RepID=UPI001EE670ED